MTRPLIPDDDLYARLELPTNASPEAIELAWRSLLRRHHPDVAGDPTALERAKRINVAHDWLSDPALRSRYDAERLGVARGRPVRRRPGVSTPASPPRPHDAPRRRGQTPPERLHAFLDRVERLTDDELARLAVAEPPPIAFLATLRRILPAEEAARLDAVDADLAHRVPGAGWADLRVREALRAVVAELVAGERLDDLLAEPFRSRTRERLLRAWEASVGQPRYGPNGAAVLRLLDRVHRLTPDEVAAFVRASAGFVATERPWPAHLEPDEHEGLRVSASVAERDVTDAAATRTSNARARRLLGRLAHATALRHALPAREYAAEVRAWEASTAEVHMEPRGRIRRTRSARG